MRNFTSAAAGIAIAVALIRGLVRRSSSTIGNFWVDLTRAHPVHPAAPRRRRRHRAAWQGVTADLRWPGHRRRRCRARSRPSRADPFASQEIIKELGTNGGGPLNANSAHPFENPNGLTNWIEMFAILIIPFGLTYTFGRMAGDQRQGWTIFAAMAGVLVVGAVVAMAGETGGNPLFPAGVDQQLGSMEGKEIRFGAGAGGLWAAVTTGTSTGAVNAMHDSFQPIAGLVPLFLMQLGEVTPGGVGAGLYGMLILGAILSVFIAGLMVGRTPEYLGKKVEAFEMKMAMLVITRARRQHPRLHRAGHRRPPEGQAGPLNAGPHGFTEILYAFSSQTGNNGSAFAGLTGNTPFYNTTGGLAMLIGRFGDDHPDPRHRGLHGRQAPRRAVAGHVPHDRARCSSCSSSAWSSSWARSRTSRRSPSDPSSSSSSRTPGEVF